VTIFLHAGTLASLVVFYRRPLWDMVFRQPRLLGMIILASIHGIACGLDADRLAGPWLENMLVCGFGFMTTGLFLLGTSSLGRGQTDYVNIRWWQALVIGLIQVTALLPGLSRSGSTIFGGLLVGLRRESAATFSFLLGVPVIAAACAWQLVKTVLDVGESTTLVAVTSHPEYSLWQMLLGVLISFVVGLMAIYAVVRINARRQLHWFAYWVLPLGAAVIVWQLAQMLGYQF
jgi:undecaprenyl-diphosphatase